MDLLQSNPFGAVTLQHFAEDDLIFEDQDELDAAFGAEGEPESTTGQPETPPTTEEVLYAIAGEDGAEQQVPFGKLTPDHVKPWYEAHQNKADWNKSNTEKAKQLADERRAHEAEKQQYTSQLQQLDTWTNYFKTNQGLQQLVAAFVQGRIPQETLQKILGQQAGQQPGATQGYNPALAPVMQRITALETQLRQERETRLQDRQVSEREKAMNAVLGRLPEEQREPFKQYIEEKTANMDDLTAMYALMEAAFMWEKNRPQLVKKTQAETLANAKKKQAAAVETGTQGSAGSLPNNVDNSGSRDIRRAFEELLDHPEAYS